MSPAIIAAEAGHDALDLLADLLLTRAESYREEYRKATGPRAKAAMQGYAAATYEAACEAASNWLAWPTTEKWLDGAEVPGRGVRS